MSTPSAALAASHFPTVPFTRSVDGTESLLSIDKAREQLWFAPSTPGATTPDLPSAIDS